MIGSAPKHHGLMALSVLPGKALFASGGFPERHHGPVVLTTCGSAGHELTRDRLRVLRPLQARPAQASHPASLLHCGDKGAKQGTREAQGRRGPRAKHGLGRPRGGQDRAFVASTSPCARPQGTQGPRDRAAGGLGEPELVRLVRRHRQPKRGSRKGALRPQMRPPNARKACSCGRYILK
jgi:hypothetical protein